MEEQTAQLASEVAILREDLVTKVFKKVIKQLSEVIILSLFIVDVGATFRPL